MCRYNVINRCPVQLLAVEPLNRLDRAFLSLFNVLSIDVIMTLSTVLDYVATSYLVNTLPCSVMGFRSLVWSECHSLVS